MRGDVMSKAVLFVVTPMWVKVWRSRQFASGTTVDRCLHRRVGGGIDEERNRSAQSFIIKGPPNNNSEPAAASPKPPHPTPIVSHERRREEPTIKDINRLLSPQKHHLSRYPRITYDLKPPSGGIAIQRPCCLSTGQGAMAELVCVWWSVGGED